MMEERRRYEEEDEIEHMVSKLLKKLIADSTRDKDMQINELEEEISKLQEESHVKTFQIEQIQKEVQTFIGASQALIKTRNYETIGKWETSKVALEATLNHTSF
ncbi:hypothetical protein Tco_1124628 [Tanacetum coccineum]|uniref:Uncharacterized protein n=1 Tax=Tanacetum coccineum TaxID=301880 RepID=A0ABQ5J6S3_9ASTR